jgi:uncharacterized protein (DUF934 family)
MRKLIKDRKIVDDDWVYPGSDAAATQIGPRTVLPLAEYLAARAEKAALWLKPEDHDLSALKPLVSDLPLIVIYFGSTGEGRGYTQARLLRDRFGFVGELRASGAVRIDQIFLLARCGFNAFDLAEGENFDAALAQLERFTVAYQQGPSKALANPRLRYGHP